MKKKWLNKRIVRVLVNHARLAISPKYLET